ncbi:hypothetical protein FOA43_004143 [Brettanomyces nanus]|uniref:SCD domain-containing protein n=1 Tax=Eeniella nana TaxID=13502 RepID=A0A875SB16_EENNA|nr:uncharacterized protein FOA43_004143 [Brettanomyces nanus]QPG76749.1 hypothetical protein FOA43_004143 [Brettanomyces nanus]
MSQLSLEKEEENTIGARTRRGGRSRGRGLRRGTRNNSSDLDEQGDSLMFEEEEEDSDPEFDDIPRHTNKRRRITHSRRHGQQHHVPNDIDDIDDFEENTIFQALSDSDVAVSELAADWIDDFANVEDETTKQDAVRDLVNFVLRSCGCVSMLSSHDVADTDHADETIAEVQQLFLSQGSHEYPLWLSSRMSNKQWKGFRERASEFMKQLLFVSSERGLLYENEEFMETILAWLGTMSAVNERSMRFTATFYSIQLESALCQIYVETAKFINRCQRQLTSEKENLKKTSKSSRSSNSRSIDSVNKRIERVQSNFDSYSEKKQYLEKQVKNIFNTFFVHRYRDTNANLRKECIYHLGLWMKQLPEIFFKPIYLRYFGWLLTDPVPSVRIQVMKSLIPLYQRPSTISALRLFSNHFKDILLKMATHEVDVPLVNGAIALLSEMVKNGFLDDDQILDVTSLLFSEHSMGEDDLMKINKELAKFVSTVEHERFKEYTEGHSATIKAVNSTMELDLNEMLKFKFLSLLLQQAEEKSLNDGNVKSFRQLKLVAEALFSVFRYNMKGQSLEFLIEYLLFDMSSLIGLDSSLKSSIELSSADQFHLLNLIYGATEVLVEGDKNQIYKSVISKRATRFVDVEGQVHDRDYYLVKIITKMPKLVDFFNKNEDTLSMVTLIATALLPTQSGTETNIFRATNQEPALVKIVMALIQSFVNTTIPLLTTDDCDDMYLNSMNYPYGLFFKSVPCEYPEIRLRMEELSSAFIKSLHVAMKNDSQQQKDGHSNIDAFTLNVIRLRLICENATVFEKVMVDLIDQIDDICAFLCKNVASTDNASSFLTSTSGILKKVVLQNFAEMVNHAADYIKERTDDKDLPEHVITLIPKTRVITSSLLMIIEDEEHVSFESWFNACIDYSEIMAILTLIEKQFLEYYSSKSKDGALLKHQVDHALGDLSRMSQIPDIAQEKLVKCFAEKEFQYAQANNLQDEISIPLSERNDIHKSFEEQGDDVDHSIHLLKDLCHIGAAMKMLSDSGAADKALANRVERNAGPLGDEYRYCLINSRTGLDDMLSIFRSSVEDRLDDHGSENITI